MPTNDPNIGLLRDSYDRLAAAYRSTRTTHRDAW